MPRLSKSLAGDQPQGTRDGTFMSSREIRMPMISCPPHENVQWKVRKTNRTQALVVIHKGPHQFTEALHCASLRGCGTERRVFRPTVPAVCSHPSALPPTPPTPLVGAKSGASATGGRAAGPQLLTEPLQRQVQMRESEGGHGGL